jgi:hypothetical protein
MEIQRSVLCQKMYTFLISPIPCLSRWLHYVDFISLLIIYSPGALPVWNLTNSHLFPIPDKTDIFTKWLFIQSLAQGFLQGDRELDCGGGRKSSQIGRWKEGGCSYKFSRFLKHFLKHSQNCPTTTRHTVEFDVWGPDIEFAILFSIHSR